VTLLAAVFCVAVLAGGTAAVSGFGIGSLLTPLVAAHLGMSAAVAAVALPHAAATALRTWRLRASIDGVVLRRFGLPSAAGGLAGGLLYAQLGNRALTLVLGALLLATAGANLADLASRWHPRGATVGALGLLSGFFGGVAGNQGGLRAAALLSFGLAPQTFVATSTATGLLVDAARTPLYLWRAGGELGHAAPLIAVATAGVLLGTLLGERLLLGLPAARFRRIVSGLIGLLGLGLLVSAA